MKKKFLMMLGLCFVMGLAACGKAEDNEVQNPIGVEGTQQEQSESTLVEPAATQAAEPTAEPTETPAPTPDLRAQYEALFESIGTIEAYKGLEDTNPIITQCFGADPYAMVYGDRVYFYMTADVFEYDSKAQIKENSYGKINTIRVVSTTDMVNFEDHGAIKVGGSQGAATWAGNSWAPAAAWKNIDGQDKFFLYFADSARGIGVLVADSPTGPFKDPLGGALINRNTPNCADITWLFDPAVLVDDDGRAYLYFGGGVPDGKAADPGNARVVELGADMISLACDPVKIDVPYLFEDSGIHKYQDKYYYTYCSNWNVDQAGTAKYGFHSAEIVSMVSDSPMGPFVVKETILENPGKYCGLYGNNHHCVFSFQGNWYITYHTRLLEKNMGIEHGYRATHIDSFTMQEDGTIGLIKQTTTGREQLKLMDAYTENSSACMAVQGGVQTVAADAIATFYGAGKMALYNMKQGAFTKVTGVDFGDTSPSKLVMKIKGAAGANGVIQVRADGLQGQVLGYLVADRNTGVEYEDFIMELDESITGVHDLYFIFSGENYRVMSWKFEK